VARGHRRAGAAEQAPRSRRYLPGGSPATFVGTGYPSFTSAYLTGRIIDRTLQTIRKYAPSAKIVVVDCPELYDLSKSGGDKRASIDLWMPKTSSTSRDQVIFVDQAADACLPSDAVLRGLDVPGGLNACPQAPGLFLSRLAAVVRAGSLKDRPADLRAPFGTVVGVAGPDMVDLTHGPATSRTAATVAASVRRRCIFRGAGAG